MEQWKTIDVNPLFEVSDFGRVRRRLIKRQPHLYYKGDVGKNGYIRVLIFFKPDHSECKWGDKSSIKERFLIHRLVAKAFIPNPNNLPIVNHKDSDPSNNHVINLEWCTAGENLRHAYATGRASKTGSKNSIAKLTEEEVLKIRSASPCPHGELARKHGVSQPTISMILSRKTWTHI